MAIEKSMLKKFVNRVSDRRKSIVKRSAITASCLIGLGLMTYYRGQAEMMHSKTEVARAVIETTEYDFGEVEPGEELCHRFSLRNGGTHRLVLNLADCGCGEGMTDHLVLMPGEKIEIPVRMKVHSRWKQQHQLLVISTSDPQNPRIELLVRGKAAI